MLLAAENAPAVFSARYLFLEAQRDFDVLADIGCGMDNFFLLF